MHSHFAQEHQIHDAAPRTQHSYLVSSDRGMGGLMGAEGGHAMGDGNARQEIYEADFMQAVSEVKVRIPTNQETFGRLIGQFGN